ncbi:MAG: AraC family transcriptional regulator [Ruminococcaceae bacterium]|nr:AraC family transcriptional regulator [Oscillospiraceae bacterium]
MNGILNIKLADKTARCFIDTGCVQKEQNFSAYHNHSYAEVHVIVKGEVVYYIEKTEYRATAGSALYIPAGIYHCTVSATPGAWRSAFLIDLDNDTTRFKHFAPDFATEFFESFEKAFETNNYAVISSFISLICVRLLDDVCECAREITDYAYAINDFFGKRYNLDITVSDLAEYLGLSEKQTTRLVKKHTEKTFVENLLDARMRTADYLCHNTDMPMAQIAKYVGYNSYGGFFKAREKYNALKDQEKDI